MRAISHIISEEIKNFTRTVISEGVETRNMRAAKHYLYSKFGMDERRAMEIIGKVKTDMPNSRLAKCKYILAATRMVMNHELSNASDIMELNKCLKIAASKAHVDEYDNDLNGMTAQETIEKFKSFAEQETEQDKEKLKTKEYKANDRYKIIRIDNFREANAYSEYVSWCVTHYENMWESYTGGGIRPFYFCLRDDYGRVIKEKGENCPLDDYGLSMIAVSVNPDGSPNTVTCRWNHENGGNDTVMDTETLSNIIGRNFYDAFPPKSEEEIKQARIEYLNKVQYEVWDILNVNDIEDCAEFHYIADGLYVFTSDNLECSALVDERESIVGDRVYDHIYGFMYANAEGKKVIVATENGKRCIITPEGEYIAGGFDGIEAFDEVDYSSAARKKNIFLLNSGYLLVEKHEKFNIIDFDGNLIIGKWFDYVFQNTFGKNAFLVTDENDRAIIDLNGRKLVTGVTFAHKESIGNRQYYSVNVNDSDYDFIYDERGQLAAPWKFDRLGVNISFKEQNADIGTVWKNGITGTINGEDVIIDEDLSLYSGSFHRNSFGQPFYIGTLIKKNPYIEKN